MNTLVKISIRTSLNEFNQFTTQIVIGELN
jgi:hypothetical protein